MNEMIKLKQTLLVFVFSFWVLSALHGEIYYVSKNGNDITGNGTQARPWATLAQATRFIGFKPGDLIQLSEGVFILSEPVTLPKGVSLRGKIPNTIITGTCFFQLEKTDFNHHYEKFLIKVPEASDQSISDFVLDGQSRQLHGGLWIGKSQRTLITNLKVRDFNWCGIWLNVSDQSEVSYCELINNGHQDNNNSTGNLQLWTSADLKLNHLYIKENRWAYGIKTYSMDWTKKEWWATPVGRITNLEISDCYIDVQEPGGWVVPGTESHAPDIAIELQGVDLLGVNIHNIWSNSKISSGLNRWGNTGQSLHIHHNIFEVQKADYSIDLNQDYAEIDHNLFFGGQQLFVQWDRGRTNRLLNIHHNYITGLNTYPDNNAVMRWVGTADSLFFQNNTVVFEKAPKKPLFFSEKEAGFTNAYFRNNLFINLSDTVRSPVFYKGIKNATETNSSLGFSDIKDNFAKNDLVQIKVSGYQLWNIRRNASLQGAGAFVGYPVRGNFPAIGAFEPSENLWGNGPDSLWTVRTLSKYRPVLRNETAPANYIPDLTLNDIFKEVVRNTIPPKVLDTIETIKLKDGIMVSKIHFQSFVDKDRVNILYAIIIYPSGKNNLPGMLILHGGGQTADDYYALGTQFAQRGYACLLPDLPGITNPDRASRKGKGSSGKWAESPYGANHFNVKPSVLYSNIYEGVTAAIQAFYLLKNQKFVNPDMIGIRGLSWGGYASVITSALLGKQVKAGIAVFGSGFYDLPSWFKPYVDRMDTDSRKAWLSSLDAGRYAYRIQAPFFFVAASNDTFFHPPAVLATFDQIKGTKEVIFSPNNDHAYTGLADFQATEFAFFDHWLKKSKISLPQILIKPVILQTDSSTIIEFKVIHNQNIKEAVVWYSIDNRTWMRKTWIPVVPLESEGNIYKAILPREVATLKGNWYVIVTDNSLVSNGSRIF